MANFLCVHMCRCVNVCKCVCTHHCPHVEVRGLLRVSVLTFPPCMIYDLIATVYIRLAAGFWEFSCLYRPSPWSCSGIRDMYYQVLEMFWDYRQELPLSWDYRHVLPCPGDVLEIQTCSGIVTCSRTNTMSDLYAGSGNLNWGSHICITVIFFTEPSSNHESLANP